MRNVPGLETVYRDYEPLGVKFFYIYKALAHPGLNGYIAPFSIEERLMHVRQAEKTLGSKIPWICDTMDNTIKHGMGDAPNSEFVIDPEGKVVRKRVWSNPAQLREDLIELVGDVARPTTVADLGRSPPPEPKKAPTGVVPRVAVPGRMQALRIEPLSTTGDLPYYVKLRAEADASLMSQGQGKLYLGFYLDPLYQVHWNNHVDAPRFEIKKSGTASVEPPTGQGPKVDHPADADPREFLVDVVAADRNKPIELTLHYFACDDAETFCHPVSQTYRVYFERDPDGGSRMGGGGSRMAGRQPPATGRRGGGGPPAAGRGRFNPGQMLEMLSRSDRDQDGRISREEAPEPFRERMFERADANGDGFIDKQELARLVERMRGGRGM